MDRVAKKIGGELMELRKKTKYQEAELKMLKQELARLEKGGESSYVRRLVAENEALRLENSKLKSARANSAPPFSVRKNDDCDPREAYRRCLDKNAPLKDVWRKFQRAAVTQDADAGTSQAKRFCDSMELYADIRDSPVISHDPLSDPLDPVDERNQRRVMHGLVLWAQLGRS